MKLLKHLESELMKEHKEYSNDVSQLIQKN